MPVAKFHIITPSSLDTSVFILERRHRNVTCVAKILPKGQTMGHGASLVAQW